MAQKILRAFFAHFWAFWGCRAAFGKGLEPGRGGRTYPGNETAGGHAATWVVWKAKYKTEGGGLHPPSTPPAGKAALPLNLSAFFISRTRTRSNSKLILLAYTTAKNEDALHCATTPSLTQLIFHLLKQVHGGVKVTKKN